ncbi:hypothetical protein A4R35_15155 [Thermogemmatispora tikiterensis]|uniref:Uncharacterized protein n=1 Tax=Thermogemmatispora tikiterensis TaxID=1825093 RepID=A0A328VP01_9CHLR|nr:hypothetical protein A4R35_15155 [Thermogemmatispora tikiterensis]
MASSWRLSSPLSTSLPESLASSPSILPLLGFPTPLPLATKANIRGPRLLASGGGDATVRIWQASTGSQELVYRGHQSCVWSVAWPGPPMGAGWLRLARTAPFSSGRRPTGNDC